MQLPRVRIFKDPVNSKLGQGIFTFSLPADLENCPGMSAACSAVCYAGRGYFTLPKMQQLLSAARELTSNPLFADWAIADIRARGICTARIHVSGDFYRDEQAPHEDAYIRKWIDIVTRAKYTTFYAYTRSWRIPELLDTLVELGELPNMHLWFSTDRHTGPAPHVSERIRHAYLAAFPGDTAFVNDGSSLVFRNIDRHVVAKKVAGVQVCPVEDGVDRKVKLTCTTCGICWKAARVQPVQIT